jgi:Metallo-peptidase family M12/IPT/TIG domain
MTSGKSSRWWMRVAHRVGPLLFIAIAASVVQGVPPPRPDVGSLSRVDSMLRESLANQGSSNARISTGKVVLERGREVTFDLESFEVWAPDARITEFSADGPRQIPVPSDRYFRGSISGEPGSLVFLAAGRTLRGLVFSGQDVWAIAPEGNAYSASSAGAPSRVVRIDLDRQGPETRPGFFCQTEALANPASWDRGAALRSTVTPLFTTTVYRAVIAVETDYELFQKLGSVAAVTSYVGDLVAASSAIYQRDIQVLKAVGDLHVYSTPSDPWTQSNIELALYELGDYWHANYAGVSRSTVHLLSGKNGGGGIAWMGAVCQTDFFCPPGGYCCNGQLPCSVDGHYVGGYGVSSSLSGHFSTTNPALYWDLLSFSHEVGHNFNSPHTHCYSPPVDKCYSGESGCYSGTTSVPAEKGTIMSYCHLLPPGYYSNIKLFLAVPGEPSVAVYGVMRSFVETQASCLTAVSSLTVTAIKPNNGWTTGGTPVTITGSGFLAGANVTIGGVAATSVVVGATTITAVTGAHATGVVDVVVTNSTGGGTVLLSSYFYVPPPVSTRFNALTPCRILDTRYTTGPAAAAPALSATSIRTFSVVGKCFIPASATAISVNASAVDPAASGELRLYPGNGISPNPPITSLLFTAGRTRANNALVLLSTDGLQTLAVQNLAAGATDFILDVNGFYAP